MSSLLTEIESARPLELDFERDPEASPARMNRFSDYIFARLRAVEAVHPEFLGLIDLLKTVGLQRIQDGIAPVMEAALAISAQLQAKRDQWEGDLLPMQLVADTLAAVMLQVHSRAEIATLLAGYAETDAVYTRAAVDALIDPLALADDVYAKGEADARYLAAALAARLLPAGAVAGSVLKWAGPGAFDYVAGGLPQNDWTEIATATADAAAVEISNIPAGYSDLQILIDGVRLSINGDMNIALSNGAQWTAGTALGFTTDAAPFLSGAISIPGYAFDAGQLISGLARAAAVALTLNAGSLAGPGWRVAGGIKGIRLSPPAGNFIGGQVTLLAR